MSVKNKNWVTPLIQWYEGMALYPHHFQQLDLRNQQVLSHHLNLISFHHWGAQDLEIDHILLPDGILRVKNVEIAMPDGLVFYYKENLYKETNISLEIDLKQFLPLQRGTLLKIFIVVPERIEKISPLAGAGPRFKSMMENNIFDENTDENPIEISRLVPNISLYAGEIIPKSCTGFPILKIKFENGAFMLDDYTPPCFYLERGILLNSCEILAQKIREKMLQLNEKYLKIIGTPIQKETEEILKPLVTILPIMESLISSEMLSPFELFKMLINASGIISQLNLSRIPPIFTPYNHNEIDQSIMPILKYMVSFIDNLEFEFSSFHLKKNNRLFSILLIPQYISDGFINVGVNCSISMKMNEIEQWVNNAIIVSESGAEIVQFKRIIGAKRILNFGDETNSNLTKNGMLNFLIKVDGEFVKENELLYIFNPSDTEFKRPESIVIFAKK